MSATIIPATWAVRDRNYQASNLAERGKDFGVVKCGRCDKWLDPLKFVCGDADCDLAAAIG